MKKKKLKSLSLNKMAISRLNRSTIKGGDRLSANACSAELPCLSKDCIVKTAECGPTEVLCESIQVHCL
ncbi:hypothetical protein ATO12_19240 [Aquimarina atlantica]|uniref:Uncharacterized protein n=1 Tax=Aquimarina atlantica TaxID=1317122 RepID=A0A023BTN4_9FLAO|nr:hypothetical protein [Aquimarina atlantica]EZH73143.1 hypothetical protein ATO12_19240 [Aquimarina atlantica]